MTLLRKHFFYSCAFVLLCELAFAQNNPFQGDWTCISKGRDISMIAHESIDDWESFAPIGNLRIAGNNIDFFEYPCQYLGAKTLTLKNNLWTFTVDPQSDRKLSLRHDTLVIVAVGPWEGMVEEYVRDTFDSKMILSLKKGIINPLCLAGEWCLVTGEWCCYGSYIEHEYPYSSIEDTIHLDSTFGGACYADQKYVVIKVDGIYQKCLVEYKYDFVVERQSLWLTPINSRKGRTPVLYRRRDEY